jgi:hypothetical protein
MIFNKFPITTTILLACTAGPLAAQPVTPPYSDELLAKGRLSNPAEGYASDFGVSVSVAKDRLAMQEQASVYAQNLLQSPGFVSLAIRHTPNFKITVFYEKGADHASMMRAAPVEIRKYLVFNPFNKARASVDQERDAIINPLRAAGLPFGLEFDYETDRFGLEIPEGADAANYTAAIPATLLPRIDIRRNTIATDVAAAYGGLRFTTGQSSCTTAWPIRDSNGQQALLTAGHCIPPESMSFPTLSPAPAAMTTVSYKNSLAEQPTYDYAMFRLGTNTTSPVINISNDPGFRNADGTANYISGITSAYYEIVAPVAIAVGQYICKQGQKTQLTCGTVVDTNWSDSSNSGNAKVSKSAQGNIAFSGDSGGPVFLWTTSTTQVRPIGIVKSANVVSSTVACKNTSTVAANNTLCYFTVMPLKKIYGRIPFQINTGAGVGFVVP